MTGTLDRGTRTRLTDGVIVLRPFTVDDADVLFRGQDDGMVRWLQWERPLTLEVARALAARWERAWQSAGPERNFAIEHVESGEVVGDCEVEDLGDGTVNVMYAVFSPWRRRGFAGRATRLVLEYAREVFPHADPVLRIHDGNRASEAVARSVGATFDGTREPSRVGPELKRYRFD